MGGGRSVTMEATKRIAALMVPYSTWIRRQFTRWPEKTWRDEYAVPLEDRPRVASNRQNSKGP
jgi:hypothetical protein